MNDCGFLKTQTGWVERETEREKGGGGGQNNNNHNNNHNNNDNDRAAAREGCQQDCEELQSLGPEPRVSCEMRKHKKTLGKKQS